ncbi:EAL domain-containing protein [Variovorax sp. HJSM1_2]|uniref:EAL domain-containing protein n=1 Tax=Variovorax sp. HJSM1_2 TaxID=3366263 RepID=UPI003BE6BF08
MPTPILLIDPDGARAQSVVAAAASLQLPLEVVAASSLAQAKLSPAWPLIDVVLVHHGALGRSPAEWIAHLQPHQSAVLCIAAGEEMAAVQALESGFADYLLTDQALAYVLTLPARIALLRQKMAAMRNVQQRQQQLDMATLNGHIGLWHWDAHTGDCVVNPAWCRMLGYPEVEMVIPRDAWKDLMHPQDQQRLLMAVPGMAHATPEDVVELRLRHKAGHWIWVLSRGWVAQRDASGAASHMAGTLVDITRRKETEATLQQQNQLLHAMSRTQTAFMQDMNEGRAFDYILEDMLALTGSTEGFITKLLTPSGSRLLAATPAFAQMALADQGVDGNNRGAGAEPAPVSAQQGRLDDILHTASTTGQAWTGRLEALGAPEASWLACMPVLINGEGVGHVVVSRPADAAHLGHGYSAADLATAAPLLGTLSHFIRAQRAERLKLQAQQALNETSLLLEQKSRTMSDMLNSISQGISLVSADQHMIAYNTRLRELLDLPDELLAARPHVSKIVDFQNQRGDFGTDLNLIAPHARDYVQKATSGIAKPSDVPTTYLRRTHTGKVLEVHSRMLLSGERVRTFTDVTSYIQAQTDLRESEARFRSLTELSSDWFWELEVQAPAGVVGSTAHSVTPAPATSAHPLGTVVGLSSDDLPKEIGAFHSPAELTRWEALIASRQEFRDQVFTLQNTTVPGLMYVSVSGLPVLDENGRFTGFRGTGQDITARKLAEAEIERLAFYDALCDLPNRRLLELQLAEALVRNMTTGASGALLFIDLDNFKDLNDTHGHSVGDSLLVQVAQRLKAAATDAAIVARFGGDEFVVVLDNLGRPHGDANALAEQTARRILGALAQPYHLGSTTHHSTPSIGIALFQGSTHSINELFKQADVAMYQAKAAGRNTLRFFNPEMQAEVQNRAELEADLRHGIHHQHLLLHYQPIVNSAAQIVGVEALVRWQHPSRGLVSPAVFIPIAEQTGLIHEIGAWVLETACHQLASWSHSSDTSHLSISVNVSARQLRQPDFVVQVLSALARTQANPRRLKIELTESMLLQNVEDVIEKMAALKDHGVGFSLDDFGTGYSSLSYLKRLPLDQLKIDQSFVNDVLTNPNDAAIARTILALAQALDLQVVAEGVETEGQRNFLLLLGCKAFQGYLFARPAPVEQLFTQLARAPR